MWHGCSFLSPSLFLCLDTQDTTFSWFLSFLTRYSFSVSFPCSSSSSFLLNIIVCQGPGLRSLCSTYTHSPDDPLEACGFKFHLHRDSSQKNASPTDSFLAPNCFCPTRSLLKCSGVCFAWLTPASYRSQLKRYFPDTLEEVLVWCSIIALVSFITIANLTNCLPKETMSYKRGQAYNRCLIVNKWIPKYLQISRTSMTCNMLFSLFGTQQLQRLSTRKFPLICEDQYILLWCWESS